MPPIQKKKIPKKTIHAAKRALQNLVEKTAVYQIDELSVDVTDLINIDFEMLDLLNDVAINLSFRMDKCSCEEKIVYLSGVLTELLEKQSDRVLQLNNRLSDADCKYEPMVESSININPAVKARCERLNRLRGQAEKKDFLELKAGKDAFSSMNLSELNAVLKRKNVHELWLRLKASGVQTTESMETAARWVARGLDVRHAVKKVQIDIMEKVKPERHTRQLVSQQQISLPLLTSK